MGTLYLGGQRVTPVIVTGKKEAGRNIGEIIESTIPLVDAGLHLLDGGTILGGGIYDNFVKYMQALYEGNAQYANIYTTGVLNEENGVIGGFSNTSWATLIPFSPAGQSWEIFFKLTTDTIGTAQFILCTTSAYEAISLYIDANGILHVVSYDNDTSTELFSMVGSTNLLANTTYYASITYNSALGYTLKLGTSADNLTTEAVSAVTTPVTSGQTLALGVNFGGSGVEQSFEGTIDLNESYIDVGTNRWWTGRLPLGFVDESAWEYSVNKYGVCGKFVYDNVRNTVRLPKITGSIEGTTDIAALGELVEAGLPNITGEITSDQSNRALYGDEGTGALRIAEIRAAYVGTTNGNTRTCGISLDASLSSSIYGNSDTVQPQTIKVLYYIAIATSTKTNVEVDIDKIATDLNDLKNKIDDGYSGALFDVVAKDHILSFEESKGLAPLGTYVYKEAVAGARYGYADFYNKCLEEYTAEGNRKKYIKSNVNTIGNPVNNEGVVSNLTTANYFLLPETFNPGNRTWEFRTKIRTASNMTVYNDYAGLGNEKMALGIANTGAVAGKFTFGINYSGSAWEVEGQSTLVTQPNTDYWIKVNFTGTTYTLAYSTDGANYVTDIVLNSSNTVYGDFSLGRYVPNPTSCLQGSMDLNETYIDIEGQRWWTGTNSVLANVNGHMFYDIKDKSWVDDLYNTTGEAWFYGIDTASERIFLPRSTRIKFGGISEVGEYQEAGLPDHNHSLTLPNVAGNNAQWNSAAWGGDDASYRSTKGTTTNASESNSIYGASNTVEYSSTKMIPYMVVGSVDSETAATDIVDVTTTENDTLPLFTGMYFDVKPNNAAWVLAGGQVANGNIYSFAYNQLTIELRSPKYDLKIIREQDMQVGVDYSEYWVVNEVSQYFICPTKLSFGVYNVEGEVPVKGNGMALGLTNGVTKFGLRSDISTAVRLLAVDTNYNTPVGTVTSASGAYPGASTSIGVTGAGESGLVADLSGARANAGLYFKVANAVQNLEVLDAGEVLEAVNDLIPDNSSLIAGYGMPSDKAYARVELQLENTNTDYTAPANGYFALGMESSAANQFVGIGSARSDNKWYSIVTNAVAAGNWCCVLFPVCKNEIVNVDYTCPIGNLLYFRFIYAQGSESEAQ